MSALTITHQIAAPLEVIPADLGLKAQNLATAIRVLDVVDAVTLEAGNRLLLDAHAALKDLEAARVRLKKPITELGREIDKIVAGVADPLEQAKRSMLGKVNAHQRKVAEEADRIRREAEARAAAERAAAEAERARLQAEADAKAKQEAEELAAVLGKPVEPEKVHVEVPKPAAPVIVPAAPVLEKPAAQIVKVPALFIHDPAALAAWLFSQGRGDLVEFKTRDIKTMLDAGVKVDGAVIQMREQNRMARG